MVDVKEMDWEVIEVYHEHDQVNIKFSAQGAIMKWLMVRNGETDIEKIVAACAPMAARAIAKQLEPSPELDAMLGKKGKISL